MTSFYRYWANCHLSPKIEQNWNLPQRSSKIASFLRLSKLKSFDRDWTNWNSLAETLKMTSSTRDWANWHPPTEIDQIYVLPQKLNILTSFNIEWALTSSPKIEPNDILQQSLGKLTSSRRDWAKWHPLAEIEQNDILSQIPNKLTFFHRDWANWHPPNYHKIYESRSLQLCLC